MTSFSLFIRDFDIKVFIYVLIHNRIQVSIFIPKGIDNYLKIIHLSVKRVGAVFSLIETSKRGHRILFFHLSPSFRIVLTVIKTKESCQFQITYPIMESFRVLVYVSFNKKLLGELRGSQVRVASRKIFDVPRERSPSDRCTNVCRGVVIFINRDVVSGYYSFSLTIKEMNRFLLYIYSVRPSFSYVPLQPCLTGT